MLLFTIGHKTQILISTPAYLESLDTVQDAQCMNHLSLHLWVVVRHHGNLGPQQRCRFILCWFHLLLQQVIHQLEQATFLCTAAPLCSTAPACGCQTCTDLLPHCLELIQGTLQLVSGRGSCCGVHPALQGVQEGLPVQDLFPHLWPCAPCERLPIHTSVACLKLHQ